MAKDVSINDFGLLIAYVLPGFTTIWGSAVAMGSLDWKALTRDGPSLAGFLSTTVVALAVGLTLSTLRWLIIDPLHHATGIRCPERNFAALAGNVEAYTFLNDAHYRHYQHAAGMFLATIWVYAVWRWAQPARTIGLADLGVLAVAILYYLGSRDALKKFYGRTDQLLAQPPAPVVHRTAEKEK
jgi:hypothetical protein